VSGGAWGREMAGGMARGDVEGRAGRSWSTIAATRPDWVSGKKIPLLIQLALHKHPDLPDVPLVTDLAKTPEQKNIIKLMFARQVVGRPYAAPPGIPSDRLALLRRRVLGTMGAPDFLHHAKKLEVEVLPGSGART